MTDLNDICYEHIKDSFYYGKFGPFKLVIDRDTGFFNASRLCNEGGKKFTNWLKLKSSKSYIAFLQNLANPYDRRGSRIMNEIRGGFDELEHLVKGTYVTKDLITKIACWISDEFGYKVNLIVIDYFLNEIREEYRLKVGESTLKIEQLENMKRESTLKIEELEKLTKESTLKIEQLENMKRESALKIEQLENMTKEIEQLENMKRESTFKIEQLENTTKQNVLKIEQLEKVKKESVSKIEQLENLTRERALKIEQLESLANESTTRIQRAIRTSEAYQDDLAPKTRNPCTRNMFAIVEKNAGDDEKPILKGYRYYVIRCQTRIFHTLLARLRRKYPRLAVRYVKNYSPNSINLFNRAKESLSYLKCRSNHLAVDDVDRFVRDLEGLLVRSLPAVLKLRAPKRDQLTVEEGMETD